MNCDDCDGSGWSLWPSGTWAACANCNDDERKPKPMTEIDNTDEAQRRIRLQIGGMLEPIKKALKPYVLTLFARSPDGKYADIMLTEENGPDELIEAIEAMREEPAQKLVEVVQ